jgi:ribonuclease HI
VLNNFQINSRLVWDYHQSLENLTGRNRIQLVEVPGHVGIYGNEMANEIARKGSSHPLIGPGPALGV